MSLVCVTKVKAKRKEMRDGGVHDVQIPVKDNERKS